MRVGALVRAADDHVHVLPRKRGKALVEIEIVAGHKAKANALDLNDVRLAERVAVANVQLVAPLARGLDLARRGVRLVVLVDHVALAVQGVGGVAPPGRRLVCRIEKDDGVAPLRGRACARHDVGVKFRDRGVKGLLALAGGRHVGIFGQDDDICIRLHRVQQIGHAAVAGIQVLFGKGIIGLNDIGFHIMHRIFLFCAGRSLTPGIIAQCREGVNKKGTLRAKETKKWRRT